MNGFGTPGAADDGWDVVVKKRKPKEKSSETEAGGDRPERAERASSGDRPERVGS